MSPPPHSTRGRGVDGGVAGAACPGVWPARRGAQGARCGGRSGGAGAAHARCIVLTENAVGFESGGGVAERVPPADRETNPLQVSAWAAARGLRDAAAQGSGSRAPRARVSPLRVRPARAPATSPCGSRRPGAGRRLRWRGGAGGLRRPLAWGLGLLLVSRHPVRQAGVWEQRLRSRLRAAPGLEVDARPPGRGQSSPELERRRPGSGVASGLEAESHLGSDGRLDCEPGGRFCGAEEGLRLLWAGGACSPSGTREGSCAGVG